MGKNWPNKYTRPYNWQIIPKTGHRIMTKNIPPKKLIIPTKIYYVPWNRKK
jgi:hypothetical protein